MKVEIKVPSMGESINEATVSNIIKPNGSKVSMDDEILELETDKVNQLLYAPKGGTIQLNVAVDQTVKIGQVIGFIDTEGVSAEETPKEVKKETPAEEKPAPVKESPKVSETTKKAVVEPKETSARLKADDFVKELQTKTEDKTIPSEPVEEKEAAFKPPVSSERRETKRKMSKIRRVIAARLVEVQQTTAMLTTFNEIDLTHVIALREKYKESFQKRYGAKLGFMSFFVKASVSALQKFPDFNSYLDGDDIVHREYYDLGIAVGTDRGLIVPVVRDCDHLSFAGIESSIEDFAKKAREGTLTADELQGGGFTITNGGVYGSLLSTPILNPPQSGILGMHKIEKRAVVIDDQIVIRPMMYVALSYDHRIVDGKEAVSFLVHIKNCLEDPARILLEL